MDQYLLKTKKVLSVCMETTAGGRNYSGGLGALYGDTTRTMDRLGASFLAVTPIYKNGYVSQYLTDHGVTDEYPEQDFTEDYEDTGLCVSIPMLHREIKVKLWHHKHLKNAYGLDTYLPENGEFAKITNNLYGENGFGIYDGEAQRLMQEVILGAGSILVAQKVHFPYEILHLNEGHGVFAALYRIAKLMENDKMSFEEAWQEVRRTTVFTTHTPIGAGNKSRPIKMIMDLGMNFGLTEDQIRAIGSDSTGTMFGSTTAALRVSKIANAVALRHQSTSHELWKDVSGACPIMYIDNGVDIEFWQHPDIRQAAQEHLVSKDRLSPDYQKILKVHAERKEVLIREVEKRNHVTLRKDKIIVGFARRVIEYKRADLIFEDLPRFERLIHDYDFQIIFSGKTHPKDIASKGILLRLYEMSKKYPNNVVFLQNYDVEIARLMTQGCDVWLGNPQIPLEACSTSGMKAAANGVVNLSTADGWWYRSARYNVNGWTIGKSQSHDKWRDAEYLYEVLEHRVLPTFYHKDKTIWAHMMLASIYTAEEECSTDRMVRDYYAYLYNAPYLG